MLSSPFLKSSSLFTTKINLSLDCFPPTDILSATLLSKLLSSSTASCVAFIIYKTTVFEDSESIL